MTLRTKLSQARQWPVLHQMPSHSLSLARARLNDVYKELEAPYLTMRYLSYRDRLVKDVAICSLRGANLASQSAPFTLFAMSYYKPLRQSLARFEAIGVPYTATRCSSMLALTVSCALAGTNGAQALHAPAPEPIDSALVGAPESGWDNYVQPLLQSLGDMFAYGALGMVQMGLDAQGARFAQRGHSALAAGCKVSAIGLLCALEVLRVPTQAALLGIELVPAIPYAMLGAIVGLGVFLTHAGEADDPFIQDGATF